MPHRFSTRRTGCARPLTPLADQGPPLPQSLPHPPLPPSPQRLPLRRAFLPMLPMLLVLGAAPAPAAQAVVIDRDAFSRPLGEQDEATRERFLRGRSLFRRAWVVGPTADGAGAGLGPLYNRLSCIACHPANGRGRSPDGPQERLQSMLVRLSLPGQGPHGGPRPLPAYGDQLNEEGVPGVPGEARVALRWQETRIHLPDGQAVSLRRPLLAFSELGYGPLPRQVLTSPRVGQGVYGLGLLAAVPEAVLRAWATQPLPDGVRGRLNRVWDPVAQRMAVGRFGWKANVASLEAQVVQAAAGDLGLSSPALPHPACAPRQTACQQAGRVATVLAAAASGPASEASAGASAAASMRAPNPPAARPELSAEEVAQLTLYLRELAPPPAQGDGEPSIERGRQLFGQAGCVHCHRPALPLASGGSAAAYTDLLLHDLGPGLADGRPDFAASGRHWRTAPLWGLGRVPGINEHSQYLHDGRARSLLEAVLWHDGEARASRQRFAALSRTDREAVLAFVASR